MWYRAALRKIAARDGADGLEPWQMTRQQFLDHHCTGYIPSNAYNDYRTSDGINFIKENKYSEPYQEIELNGKLYNIRRDPSPLQYAKWGPKTFTFGNDSWEGEDIVRDENGMAVMLTDEEMQAKGLPTRSQDLAAFHEGKPVGFAADEFGATGVWVVDDHQGNGLGMHLLREFRKNSPHLSKMGQMTDAGYRMTGKYHKMLVQDALKAGLPVSSEVLADYPDLIGDN
jgi:GNAT superfamily N-acetyltransferase